MLAAVLFDWGDTLMRWAWEPELLSAGHDAGLGAIGREPAPAMTERFRDAYLPLLWVPGTLEEIEYPALVRELLGEEGIEVTDAELELFLEAEHTAWSAARMLATTTHALLEALRDRGLKVGLVSNALDPPGLLHRDLEQMDVANRLDVAVFSSEVGWRKPHPAIFERALDAIGVDPADTLFVGDTLATDVAGAAALGMHTCQALWFRADEDEDAPEPDFRAFTQMDVMTLVRRLS
ncbi:MAG: HAD family hydrolase [Gaiellaceae bacterium]